MSEVPNPTPTKMSYMSCGRGYSPDNGDFKFKPVPEAPVFRPTDQEFALGPLAYVAKIRPLAEPFGICKIIPPKSFRPSFDVDVNRFKFTPRVQRLNELEALTRIKLNFLEQLIKFWDLNGRPLKIPTVEKRPLDLHMLHKVVQDENGFEYCTRERKWSKVASRLGYTVSRQNKGPIASLLRQHYERLLFPYDVFMSGATIGPIDDDLLYFTTGKCKGDSDTITNSCTPYNEAANDCNSNSTGGTPENGPCNSSDMETECQTTTPTTTTASTATTATTKTLPSDSLPDSSPCDKSTNQCTSSDGDDSNCKINGRKATDEPDGQPEKKQLRRSRRMMGMQNRPVTRSNLPNIPIGGIGSSKELKKLQVHGAGPKMPGVLPELKANLPVNGSKQAVNTPTAAAGSNGTAPANGSNNEITQVKDAKEPESKLCVQCGDDSNAISHLVTCISCSSRYHLHCLIPPLNDPPKNSWHCARCIAYKLRSQPQSFTHEFGFAQSPSHYTLAEFTTMADNFKQDYFRMKPRDVPLDVVEREFWRILSSLEDTVVVEYGADLHTSDYGSGFASLNDSNGNGRSKVNEYIKHPWNLNNLPILNGSVFKHINTNISGMIVPWMYVGMCFSTFCWHNEDHWSYSINYLHWGEAKSWYGVPGEHAITFEKAMGKIAPELFESQPDLLHQLVTICNPNVLMAQGVPIYKCHQGEGEFVITFPRAYHAGYNQGMNFAEAVNFAPADWLPIGRICVTHYSMLHRYPVFSHDELICKMASDANSLDSSIVNAAYQDMSQMISLESAARMNAFEWGCTRTERETFELYPDDERQCEYCKTTCFLSAITCQCSPKKLVCILHRDHLCSKCQPRDHILKYRYTLDELPFMLNRLKLRADEVSKGIEKSKIKSLEGPVASEVETNENQQQNNRRR